MYEISIGRKHERNKGSEGKEKREAISNSHKLT